MILKINQIEKSIYTWALINKYKIIVLIIISFLVQFITHLPYFNLFFTREITLPTIAVFAIFIFKVKIKKIFQIVIVLFLFTFVTQILDRREIAESLGNAIYIILFVGVFKGILELKE